jgi:hypothetical protein
MRIESYKPYMQGLPQDKKLKASAWEERISQESGGYNPVTKKFTPFDLPEGLNSGHEVFDALTAACEAGVLDTETWATACFSNKETLSHFLDELMNYNDEFRVMDRWAQAFMALGGSSNYEGGYCNSEQMAHSLHEHLMETGQYAAFDKPKLKPSAKRAAAKKPSRARA